MFPSFSFTVSDAAPKMLPKKPFTASSPFLMVSFIFVMVSVASMPIADRAPPTTSKNPDANPPRNERIASKQLKKKSFRLPTAADAKSRAPEKSPLNRATTIFTTLVTKLTRLDRAFVSGVRAAIIP